MSTTPQPHPPDHVAPPASPPARAAPDPTRRPSQCCAPAMRDDDPRPDDRQRGPALDPGRPGLQPSGLARVVNAYMVAFGGLLLLAGRR